MGVEGGGGCELRGGAYGAWDIFSNEWWGRKARTHAAIGRGGEEGGDVLGGISPIWVGGEGEGKGSFGAQEGGIFWARLPILGEEGERERKGKPHCSMATIAITRFTPQLLLTHHTSHLSFAWSNMHLHS